MEGIVIDHRMDSHRLKKEVDPHNGFSYLLLLGFKQIVLFVTGHSWL